MTPKDKSRALQISRSSHSATYRKLGPPLKLYRIGELVHNTPLSRQTIHNYTIMGLIREIQWTQGGHRLYDESVFEKLSKIIELKKTKTLCQIRQILNKEEINRKAAGCRLQSENN